MDSKVLAATAKAMVAPGKGILAIDESSGTCKKRFDGVNVECTEENRRAYRELLVSAPGVEQYISGMILYDETIRQKDKNEVPFAEVLKQKGIIPGIKVDAGTKPLALHEGEVVTEGLDGLRDRLVEYGKLGAQFAKWRAVIAIGANMPSQACIMANAHALARYAALCQENGLVPMVEPEILIDGNHTIEKCYEVTALTLKALFSQLAEQGVDVKGTILKVSMVLPGKDAEKAPAAEVAKQTVKCLMENVPHDLAGVVFLSGGQSDSDATIHLDLMNKIGGLPWPLSFSYGRAIQSPALKIWAQDIVNNVGRAQQALVHRSKCNGLAALGKYDVAVEKEFVA
ncbi:MAG: class I fructose-bisphosphate aldolase [Candidatus Gracilibacteria bacterium]|jgi:fructose-bisphosphate aldolase class I